MVKNRDSTDEGAQIEGEPPAAGGEGAPEAAAKGPDPPLHPQTPPSPAPPWAYLASQNFLVRQGRSWFRRLRNQRWVCRSVSPHWVARRLIWGWGGSDGGQGHRGGLLPLSQDRRDPALLPPSPIAPDLACGVLYLWRWGSRGFHRVGVPPKRGLIKTQPCSQTG